MTEYKIFKNSDKRQDSNRLDKLASLIQKIVSDFFVKQEIIDEENQLLFVIISKVTLNGDLKLAKIFVRCFNQTSLDKISFIQNLEKYNIILHKILAKKICIKYPPKIKFYYDESFGIDQNSIEYLAANNILEGNDQFKNRK